MITSTWKRYGVATHYYRAGTVDKAIAGALDNCQKIAMDGKHAATSFDCKLHSIGNIFVHRMNDEELKAAIQFYQRNRNATNDDFASRFTAGTAAMLFDAARIGDAAGVRVLLDQGVDIDGRTDIGETALILAAHGGHAKTVEALLAGGADVNAKSNFGSTALMRAAFKNESLASTQLDVSGYREIIRLLKQAGAKK